MKNRKIGHLRPKNRAKIVKVAIFAAVFGVLGLLGHFIYQSSAASFSVRCKYGTGTCSDSYKHWFGDGFSGGYKYGEYIDTAGANPRTSEYIITYNGTDYEAMCSESMYGNALDSGGSIYENTNATIKAVLLTAPTGPLYNASIYNNMKSSTGLASTMSYNDDYGIAHSMVSLLYSGQSIGWSQSGLDRLRNGAQFFLNYVQSAYPSYLTDYKVMNLARTDTETYFVQDLVFLMPPEEDPTPSGLSITLTKLDSADNTPVAGAIYGVYEWVNNSTAGSLIATFPATNASGRTTVGNLAPGPYFVKEIVSPSGYMLNTDLTYVYLIENDPDGGETITVRDRKEVIITTGSILIRKTAPDGTVLSGAKFGLYQSDCATKITSVVSVVSGTDGRARFENIAAGSYCIVEEAPPEGYVVGSPQMVTVEAGVEKTLTFVDTRTSARLRVKKTSSNETITEGNPNYTLRGAEFYVCTDATCGTVLTTLTTDVNGFTGYYTIEVGEIYYVKEKTAPEGFGLNSGSFGARAVAENEVVEVTVADTPISGAINIVKKDAESGLTTPYEGGSFAGTTFSVINNSGFDVVYNGGRYYDGTEVWHGTLGEGEYAITVNGLPFGDYIVKEIEVGEGYALNTTEQNVEISNLDRIANVEIANARRAEEPEEGIIRIRKVSGNTSISEENSHYSLAGAEFLICRNVGCSDVVTTLRSKENGLTDTFVLPAGTYYVKEKTAPEGFLVNNTVQTAVITNDKLNIVTVSVTDEPMTGEITIVKRDAESGEAEPYEGGSFVGTTFAIVNNSGFSVFYGGENHVNGAEIARKTLGEGEYSVSVSGLPFGDYIVKEVAVGEGYQVSAMTTNVSLDNEVMTATVQFSNDRIPAPEVGRLRIRKVSSDSEVTNGNPGYSLENAEFQICKDSGCRNVLTTMKTDADGYTRYFETEIGTYYIKETKAPRGYQINNGAKSVMITGGDLTVDFENDPITGMITIVKRDKETGDTYPYEDGSFAGTEFSIINKSGFAMVINGERYEDGDEVFRRELSEIEYGIDVVDVPFGTYIVRETKAGDGYEVNTTEFTVTISVEEKNVIVDFYNKRVEVIPEPEITPDTGMFTGVREFLKENVVKITTFGMLIGVVVVVFARKRLGKRVFWMSFVGNTYRGRGRSGKRR